MELNFTKSDLVEQEKEFTFTSEDSFADVFFTEHLNKFCIFFNAKLETFKTFSALKNRLTKLIDKHDLKLTSE